MVAFEIGIYSGNDYLSYLEFVASQKCCTLPVLSVLQNVDSDAATPGLPPKYACLLEKRVILGFKVLFQDGRNGEIADHGIQLGFELEFHDQANFTLLNRYSLTTYLVYSIPKFIQAPNHTKKKKKNQPSKTHVFSRC